MQPQEQPVMKIGQLEIRYLIDGTVTGAGVGMFELTVPPGARVPPAHSHRDNEEVVYVLDGVLRTYTSTRIVCCRWLRVPATSVTCSPSRKTGVLIVGGFASPTRQF
jgi:hypothetical protein